MIKHKRKNINSLSSLYCKCIRFVNALKKAVRDLKTSLILITCSLIGIMALYSHRLNSGIEAYYSKITVYDIEHSILTFTIMIGLFILLYLLGAPIESWSVSRQLYRTGITNSVGEAPYLLNKTRSKDKKYFIYEFLALGNTVTNCEDKRSEMETALNANILAIKQGKNRKTILVYAIPYKNMLDSIIPWHDNLLSTYDFELSIGEAFIGRIIVDLNKIPHMLIGGSTGSGKSYLLKSLLWQCIKKDAEVYIADFKGGVDFATGWHKKATIITDIDALIETLSFIVNELERRKVVFYEKQVKNIVEYNNSHLDNTMARIIFACDEVAELLDKTGLDKESKEKISIVENKLSTIARLERAFGINLILSTQRPDANILSGQIKNNIGTKLCGRADEVLSRIILDDTIAAKNIPDDAQGLFITNNGTLIKSYYFEDSVMDFE